MIVINSIQNIFPKSLDDRITVRKKTPLVFILLFFSFFFMRKLFLWRCFFFFFFFNLSILETLEAPSACINPPMYVLPVQYSVKLWLYVIRRRMARGKGRRWIYDKSRAEPPDTTGIHNYRGNSPSSSCFAAIEFSLRSPHKISCSRFSGETRYRLPLSFVKLGWKMGHEPKCIMNVKMIINYCF